MIDSCRILALSGGVGGAKMAQALLENMTRPSELTVVCNTADDFEHLGLHVSPDIDSVLYRLANLHDDQRGWGRRNETWNCLTALQQLSSETWFRLGDRDLATHIQRTQLLARGANLSAVTDSLRVALGIECAIRPMTDQPVRTQVETERGTLEFQHYFVKERCSPRVIGFHFSGIEQAIVSEGFDRALASTQLELVVLCPSNPFVSMDPILNLPGVVRRLAQLEVPVIAISPIVGGKALKGPAAKMMEELGVPVSALSVARHYAERGFLTHFLIDPLDQDQVKAIEDLGLEVLVVPALLNSPSDRNRVARAVLTLAPLQR